MDLCRVPPAVSFAFEQVVSKICDEAKVDYDERAFVARELQNHLESFWRREIEAGLSTEDAQGRALACFGQVRDVARNLRKPLWRRLLLFERYRAERFITFLSVSFAMEFLVAMIDIGSVGTKSINELKSFIPVGYMLNPFFALGALFSVRWKPKVNNRLIRALALVRFLPLPLIFTALIADLYGPIRGIRMMVHAGLESCFADCFLLGCFILLIPLGIVAASCFISELLGLPKRCKGN